MAKRAIPKSLQPDADEKALKEKELRLARRIQFLGRELYEDELAERVPSGPGLSVVQNNKRVRKSYKCLPRHYHDVEASTLPPRAALRKRQTPLPPWQYDEADEIRTTLPMTRRKPGTASQTKPAARKEAVQATNRPVTAQNTSNIQATPATAVDGTALQAMTDQELRDLILAEGTTDVLMQAAVNILSERTRQKFPDIAPETTPVAPQTVTQVGPIVTAPGTSNKTTLPETSNASVEAVVKAMLENLHRTGPAVIPQATPATTQTDTPAGLTSSSIKRVGDSQIDTQQSSPKKPKLDIKSMTKLLRPDGPQFNKQAKKYARVANKLPPSQCLWDDKFVEAQEIKVVDSPEHPWRNTSVSKQYGFDIKGLSVPLPCLSYENAVWIPCDNASQDDGGLTTKYVLQSNPNGHPPKLVKFNYRGHLPIAARLGNSLWTTRRLPSSVHSPAHPNRSFQVQNIILRNARMTGSPHFVEAWGHNDQLTHEVVAEEYLDRGTLAMEKHLKKLRDMSNPSYAWRVLQCLTKSISVMAYGSEDPYQRVPQWIEIVLLDWRPQNVFVGPKNLANDYHTCGAKQTCFKLGYFEQSLLIYPPGKDRDGQREENLQDSDVFSLGWHLPPESKEARTLHSKKAGLQERLDHPIAGRYNYKTNIYQMADMLRKFRGWFEEDELSDEAKKLLEQDLAGDFETPSKKGQVRPKELRQVVPNLKLSKVRFNRVLEACLRESPAERPEIGWLLAQAAIGLAEAGNTPEQPDEDVSSDS